MALGKLTLAVGAAFVGSALVKEGSSLPGFSDIFSGAFKILKHLQQDTESPKSKSTTSKPQTDSLLAQVNNLRQELQILASNRSVTIVTGSSSGSRGINRYTAIIVIGAAGYLYIRWKGWKLSDMMFVTRRGLADASAAVGKQLEQVQSSIIAAKKFLATRIDRVDIRLDECKEITESTRDEVVELHGDINAFQEDMQSVHLVVQNLETKLGRLEMSQDLTTRGIYDLCQYANRLEQQNRYSEALQGSPASSSRPAIESSKSLPLTRAGSGSLPPIGIEPPSPASSSGSAETTPTPTPKVLRATTISASGLKELQGVTSSTGPSLYRSNSIKPGFADLSNGSNGSNSSLGDLSNGSNGSAKSAEPTNGGSSSTSRFTLKLPSFSAFSRNRNPAV
ncbi:hypothetical protein LUZ60_013518 [Juncus effusus]|nr:hypothetical protein LUZ60_013518 [Juncus effusus]